MAIDTGAQSLFGQLKQAFESQPCDLKKCEQQLAQLKVMVLTSALSSASAGHAAQQEFILGRDTLELACFLSIKLRDTASFERHMAQVKMYYSEDGSGRYPPSSQKQFVQGLYLLHLLASDRIGEFHTELELIKFDDLEDEVIKHAINLERFLMEGSYAKILEAQSRMGNPNLKFFMERLLETVRQKVGASLERSYEQLPIDYATKTLILPDAAALQAFVVKENERKAREDSDDTIMDMTPSLTRRLNTGLVRWEVKDGKLWFVKSAEKRTEVPALELMVHTIGYATDLERIV